MGYRKTNKVVYLILLLLCLSLATSISFAWVLSDPLASQPQQGLDIAFVDDAGNKVTDPPLNEGNAYPGWSKASVIKIKNFGVKARYKLGLDFISGTKPCLADVLSLKTIKNGIEADYRLTDFISRPLIDTTEINGGAVHELTVVLAMDASAGNEYENLSLDLKLILYAEPISETHEPGHQNGGGDGGTTVVVTPPATPTPSPAPTATPTPEPTPTPVIESPEPSEPEPLPDSGSEPEQMLLDEAEIPQGSLPRTGGIPAILLVGIGILLVSTGYLIKRIKVNPIKK